jgi:ABC-type Zn2+ transport system substrate-binding protein/surface adhesin
MKVIKFAAIAAILVTLGASGVEAAPAGSPSPSSSPAAQPAAAPSVKPVHKRFLLSKPTAIYSAPDTSSKVLEHVHAGIHVNVTGISGDWLQLKLRTGKTGYIPTKAAE